MFEWHEVVESETGAWVRDLEPSLLSVDHCPLFVWHNEMDGQMAQGNLNVQRYPRGGIRFRLRPVRSPIRCGSCR
jgi:hypothetical protein